MRTPTGTVIMTAEELAAHRPQLLRPGLWEFTHKGGYTEEIRLVEREDPMTDRAYLAPVTNMPTVDIEEMLQAGRFTRFLGP